MGSITDALKAKGATGSNIAECIETLPSSGGSDGVVFAYFEGEMGSNNNVTPTGKLNYSREELINMMFTENKPVIFGAYLLDANGYRRFYNMVPYSALIRDGEAPTLALQFIGLIGGNLYVVGADGTITVET